jgi:hypothetical protein
MRDCVINFRTLPSTNVFRRIVNRMTVSRPRIGDNYSVSMHCFRSPNVDNIWLWINAVRNANYFTDFEDYFLSNTSKCNLYTPNVYTLFMSFPKTSLELDFHVMIITLFYSVFDLTPKLRLSYWPLELVPHELCTPAVLRNPPLCAPNSAPPRSLVGLKQKKTTKGKTCKFKPSIHRKADGFYINSCCGWLEYKKTGGSRSFYYRKT